jgi:hypothetical protein
MQRMLRLVDGKDYTQRSKPYNKIHEAATKQQQLFLLVQSGCNSKGSNFERIMSPSNIRLNCLPNKACSYIMGSKRTQHQNRLPCCLRA